MSSHFQRHPVVSEAVERLMEYAGQLDRGDVLRHEDVIRVTGLRLYGQHWNATIQRFRRQLENDRGIAVLPEVGVGYKLLTHQETVTRLPQHRRKKMLRQNTRLRRSLTSLNESELTDHQRKVLCFQMEAISRDRSAILRSGREQKSLVARRETKPQIASV